MEPIIDELLRLLNIPGPSTEEAAVAAYIEGVFRSLGVPETAIRYDRAQDQSEYGGQVGNLIIRLPSRGAHPGGSRLFMAHIDSVPLCRGTRPRLVPAEGGKPRRIVNDNPEAALGADNRTGVNVLVHLARHLCGPGVAHPPVTFVFTVQEELGLIGARGLDLAALQPDPPAMGFNYDGGRVTNVVVAVIGATRFFIDLHGKAAHTGINPQDGVSCAVAAAKAIADLARAGWHGRIERPEGKGSANIGILQGGQMTNTVMDTLVVRGEARSHDAAFRQQIVDLYHARFAQTARETRNAAGECARMDWKLGPCYDAFSIPADAPVVQTASAAMRALGIKPVLEVNDGGMDANWINARGLPMVTLGTGQHGAHTTGEWIDVDEHLAACRLVERIAVE